MAKPVYFDVSLKACRANADMTMAQWAEAIGVGVSTVSNWENDIGEPTASQLRKISELSGIPMDYICIPWKSHSLGRRTDEMGKEV